MRAARSGILLAALLAAAAAAQPAPRPPLTPPQEESLHTGMLEVRKFERNGDRAGAIARCEALLKEFPDHRRVEDALVNLYRIEDRGDALAELLRHRLQRDPDDLESTRELASVLLVRERTAEAIKVFERCIAANPRDENRYRLAASMLKGRGAIEPAIRIYRDGRRAVGDEALFAAELAQLEEARGDQAAALAEYVLLAMDPELRPRAWREIASLIERADPLSRLLQRVEVLRAQHARSAAVQDVAAMAYLHGGRNADALDAIRDADRLAGDQGEHLLDFGRTALEVRGSATVDAERAQVGVQALELLAERHPQSGLLAEAARLTAEGLVAAARNLEPGESRERLLRQAVGALSKSRGKLPSSGLENDALALEAMILFEELGRPADALPVFERLAALQKEGDASANLVRVQAALCRAALGDLDGARAGLEAVVREADEGEPTASPGGANRTRDLGAARARYHLAELDLAAGKYTEASASFAALAEQAPEDRLANDCLDMALLLNEALADDPKSLERYAAAVRARIGRDRAASRRELEALVAEQPKSALAPVAWLEIAASMADAHQTDAALASYAGLVEAHPEHRLAPRALEAIGDLQLEQMHRPDLAIATWERILVEHGDDLFLDGVRKKLLAARAALKGDAHATP